MTLASLFARRPPPRLWLGVPAGLRQVRWCSCGGLDLHRPHCFLWTLGREMDTEIQAAHDRVAGYLDELAEGLAAVCVLRTRARLQESTRRESGLCPLCPAAAEIRED